MPGIDSPNRITDFLRVHACNTVNLIQQAALATVAVQDQFLRREDLLPGTEQHLRFDVQQHKTFTAKPFFDFLCQCVQVLVTGRKISQRVIVCIKRPRVTARHVHANFLCTDAVTP